MHKSAPIVLGAVSVAVLAVVMFSGIASAGGGGVGGYYDGSEGSYVLDGTTPVPSGTVVATPGPEEGDVTSSPSLDVRGVLENTAFAGPLCGAGRVTWWVTLAAATAALLWFGRTRGTYLWLIAIFAVVWFAWARVLCGSAFSWLPVLIALGVWLLSVPRPGAQKSA